MKNLHEIKETIPGWVIEVAETWHIVNRGFVLRYNREKKILEYQDTYSHDWYRITEADKTIYMKGGYYNKYRNKNIPEGFITIA